MEGEGYGNVHGTCAVGSDEDYFFHGVLLVEWGCLIGKSRRDEQSGRHLVQCRSFRSWKSALFMLESIFRLSQLYSAQLGHAEGLHGEMDCID